MGYKLKPEYGTASLPGIAWEGDPDTGIYGSEAEVAISIAGTRRLKVTATGVEVIGVVQVNAGSAADPTLSFRSATDTGVYLTSGGDLGLSVGGSLRFSIDDDGRMQAWNNSYYAGPARGLSTSFTSNLGAVNVDTAADRLFIYDESDGETKEISIADLLSLA